MNKTPIAAGLAMIMGISVVFAFDRVKPLEDMSLNAAQTQSLEVDNRTDSHSATRSISKKVSQAGIEADILMEEAPLILESTQVQGATSDSLNELQPVGAIQAQQNNAQRSLKMALKDMQQALERLEREAEMTHQAVALMEQKYSQ